MNEPYDPEAFRLAAESPPESCRDILRREHETQIASLSRRVEELETQLRSYERSETLAPVSKQDEDTGDYTTAKDVANLLKRADVQDQLESARAHALQEMCISLELITDDLQQVKANVSKLDKLAEIVEKLPLIDPQNIRDILELLQRIPCLKGCEPDPDMRSTLHSIRCAGE